MPRTALQTDTLDNLGGSIKLFRFDGGLNKHDSNEVLKDNEAIIRENWNNDGYGAIKKVNGFTKKNSTALASAAVLGLFRVYQSDGTTKLLAICNGTVSYSDDDGTTFTACTDGTGFTTTEYSTGVNYNNLFFFTNLTNNLYHYTPSTNTVAAATSQPSNPCRILLKRSDRRMLALNNDVAGSTLYFSKIDPTGTANDDWSASNDAGSIAIDGAKSEGLVGGATFGAYDIIFKDYAAFKVWGYPAPQALRLPGSPGCAAPFSIAQGDGLCFFLAHIGVYMYDGAKFYRISDPIEEEIDDINSSYVRNAFGVYRNRYYWLFYTYTGQTTNQKVLIYDVARSNPYENKNVWFQREDMDMNCPVVFDGRGDDNELLAGDSASTGFVYRLDFSSTGDDNGSDITGSYQTKYFNAGYPHLVKAFTKIHIRYYLNKGNLLVYWYINRGATSGSFTILPSQTGVVLGTFVLDTDVLAGDVEATHTQYLPDNVVGTDISLKFYHSDDGVAPIIRDCQIDWEVQYDM